MSRAAARVVAVGCWLRVPEPSLAAELFRARGLAEPRLRGIAPGVLVSALDPTTTLRLLRQAGDVPAADAQDGTPFVDRPPGRADPNRTRYQVRSPQLTWPGSASTGGHHAGRPGRRAADTTPGGGEASSGRAGTASSRMGRQDDPGVGGSPRAWAYASASKRRTSGVGAIVLAGPPRRTRRGACHFPASRDAEEELVWTPSGPPGGCTTVTYSSCARTWGALRDRGKRPGCSASQRIRESASQRVSESARRRVLGVRECAARWCSVPGHRPRSSLAGSSSEPGRRSLH
jgi:hypothetical protein